MFMIMMMFVLAVWLKVGWVVYFVCLALIVRMAFLGLLFIRMVVFIKLVVIWRLVQIGRNMVMIIRIGV